MRRDLEAFRAGTTLVGLNPATVTARKEVEIVISRSQSSHVQEFSGQRILNLIIV
jgi:hypothetical protein